MRIIYPLCGIILLCFGLGVSSCSLLGKAGGEGKCGTFQANDTLKYKFTFYSAGKVKSIERHVKEHGLWTHKGYHYNFYENGRLKEIFFFEKTTFTPFIIRQNTTGAIEELRSNSGKDMLSILVSSIKHSNNEGQIGNKWIYSRSPNGNLKVNYETHTGNITSIEEYNDEPSGPNTYRIFKSGIYILFHKGTITNVWNYQDDKRIGENLIFSKNGKLKKFYYKEAESAGLGYKAKDLPKIVSTAPCD